MDKVAHSPPPAQFRVSATGADVADVFADTRPAACTGDPDRPSLRSRGHTERSRGAKQSWRSTYGTHACLWWDNWVAVAATGWGALVVIAPLLVTHVLIWAAGAPRDE
ncbi:MAG TPA: hypothetical protein H9755_05700 [Candidatus Dietzia intestinigallinarum]|nr:hypothetical protein [Candidatus Dietzia intestinigallinarum]